MPNWPLFSEGDRWIGIGTAAGSSGAGVTTLGVPGALNTKTSWVELTASLTAPIAGFWLVTYGDVTPNNDRHLIDVGIGAAGSEQIIVPDLYFNEAGLQPRYVWIPIGIAAGTRVAARHQSGNALGNSFVGLYGATLGYQLTRPFSRMTAYGISTATTRGTVVDPGATAGVKGSYAELAASTSFAHKACLIVAGRGDDFSAGDILWALDLSIGAAGSEQVLVPDVTIGKRGSGITPALGPSAYFGPLPLSIAAATRVAMRVLSTTNNAAQRDIEVAFYGFS